MQPARLDVRVDDASSPPPLDASSAAAGGEKDVAERRTAALQVDKEGRELSQLEQLVVRWGGIRK